MQYANNAENKKRRDRHSSDDISCFDCTVFAYSFPVDKSFCFDLWPHALCALLAGWIIVNNLKCPTVGADRLIVFISYSLPT